MPSDPESGIKTYHSVAIDDDGKIRNKKAYIGDTSFLIFNIKGGGSVSTEAEYNSGIARVHMKGSAYSVPLVLLEQILASGYDNPGFIIDYDVKLELRLCERRGTYTITHDAYPSYHLSINGKSTFNFEQSRVVSLPNLFGLMNSLPEETKSFTW